jgi:hypothetical protein
MITVVNDTRTCGVCGKKEAVMLCNGCGMPLCRDCYRFDLFAHDCGSVDTLVLCSACYDDIDINPYGAARPK